MHPIVKSWVRHIISELFPSVLTKKASTTPAYLCAMCNPAAALELNHLCPRHQMEERAALREIVDPLWRRASVPTPTVTEDVAADDEVSSEVPPL